MDISNEEKVMLVSRVSYPCKIEYEKESFMLAPKARTKKEFVRSKLKNIDPREVLVIR